MSASAKYRKEIVGLPFIGNENKDDGRPILNGKILMHEFSYKKSKFSE